jgi:hypothetical protein
VFATRPEQALLDRGVRRGTTKGIARPVLARRLSALSTHSSGRYFVDRDGKPVLLMGDSPQALPMNIGVSDMDAYLFNRARAGHKVVWITPWDNIYGGGRSDNSSYDGLLPFTVTSGAAPNGTYSTANPNLTTPNPAYWARLDYAVERCLAYGIYALIAPCDLGNNGGTANMPTLRVNSLANCQAYGRFLGSRYGSQPHVLWLHGIDFGTHADGTLYNGSTDTQLAQGLITGINAASSRTQFHMVEYWRTNNGRSDTNWYGPCTVDWIYPQNITYDYCLTSYAMSPVMPAFMGETYYEGEHSTTNQELRAEAWWTALSGSCGQLFGNHYTWQFLSGWQSNEYTAAYSHYQVLIAFLSARAWWQLVPDAADKATHSVVTAGYGTYNSTSYVQTARTGDGKLIVSYCPTGTTLTVDMTKCASSSITARWLDPTSGAFTSAGSGLTNTGTHNFVASGTNAGGDSDWVLVLES